MIKRSRKFLITFGFLIAAGFATAATHVGSPNDLIDKLQQHYQQTQSFSAKFTETLTSPGAPSRERSGTIAYLKPGKIRWQFDQPQPETIVSDGVTIFDYDPGLNQVVETPIKQAFKNQGAMAFFLGVGNLRKDFNIEPVTSAATDDHDCLRAVPKNGGDQIELNVETKTLNIVQLQITDALGNKTAITFHNIKRNVSLELSVFKFTPPAGADIINSSQQ